MNADNLLLFLFGAFVGGAVGCFATWSHARKVEDMVKGGLRAWSNYNRANAQAQQPAKDNVSRFGSGR